MTQTTIDILGKPYAIVCPESEIASLQKAADYLNKILTTMKEQGKIIDMEKILMVTALNLANRLLALEDEKDQSSQTLQNRLSDMFNKIERALKNQMELVYSE